MSRETDLVLQAIERWERAGLIDPATAERLRRESDAEAGAGTRRLSQYLLAATGGVAPLLAGGVFLDWAWPLLERAARAIVLAVAGMAVVAVGVGIETRGRWRPAASLMQTSGLGLLFAAFAYTDSVWPDLSVGGVASALASLVVPIVLAPRAMRRNTVMPAVHLAFGLAFLALFLDRATPLDDDALVWVLDAVLGGAIIVLMRLLARDPDGAQYPWVLNAFVMAMLAGFALVWLTALGPLDLDEDSVWPLDVWLGMSAALAVWGIERGPAGLRRAWLDKVLAWLLVAWVIFGFYTALEALDGPPELPLVLVGGAGVVAFLYANARGFRSLMGAAALAFIAPLWYWAVDRGGALGGVAALAATAGLLFWLSGKTGRKEDATAEA
jgi:hypothetical protein